jgi:hypothetical protein
MQVSGTRRQSLVGVAISLYAALFLVYSQTWAFTWDESYHLLASQLIAAGKTPYIDFCFPQSPLNAYWNAGLMRVFGPGWHAPHACAALFTVGAVLLTADFVFRRFPIENWRLSAAVTAGVIAGLSSLVFEYGPLAIYGICLLALMAAFRFSVLAVERRGVLPPILAGLSAGVAAGSSLLTATAAPVFLLWMLFYNRAGSRWSKLGGFALGAGIAFLPVFWLFSLGPRQTWFNLFRYHFFYRALYWPETTRHDLEVLTVWLDSGPGLLVGLLALFGLLYVSRRSGWPRALRAEFYLCAWVAAALAAGMGRAHPTFTRYFVLTVPFLAILCAVGVYAIASRALSPDRPVLPVLLITLLFALALVRSISEATDERWSVYEKQADKVDQLTPRDAPLFAEEPIYFLTRRTPPPGYELSYTHKLNLPPDEEALFHLLTEAEVKRQLQAGVFATAYSSDSGEIAAYGLKELYSQHVDMNDATIFWGWKK